MQQIIWNKKPFTPLALFLPAFIFFAVKMQAATLSTNSTSHEIQQALDALPASGGEVVLPSGVYLIGAPVALRRSHQTLRGSGSNTVLRLVDNANCPVIILGEPVNVPKHSVARVRVADLFIDGNRAQQQSETWKSGGDGSKICNNGITVQTVTDSLIENVTCGRCRSGGLVVTADTRRLTVREFAAFDNQFDGLACYATEESVFTKLFLHDNRAAGISLDLSFNHNAISNAVLAGNDIGIFMRDTRNNTFRDIVVRQNKSYGVFIAQSEHPTSGGWRLTPGTECTGNNFTALEISDSGKAGFRINDFSCSNNLIADSRFLRNARGLSQVATNLAVIHALVER